jgi:hypothetical protein
MCATCNSATAAPAGTAATWDVGAPALTQMVFIWEVNRL